MPLCHGDHHFAFAGERCAGVGGEHVVEHQDVVFQPWEADGAFVEHAADFVQQGFFEWRAVAVVDVARQVFFVHYVEQGFAHFRLQVGDVEQVRLVEPDAVVGHRVARYCLANLPGAQFAVVFPFAFDVVRPAVGFDHGLIFGVEHLTPFHIEPVAVVTHVHQFLFDKAFANARRDASVDFAAVGDRCFATRLRRDHAVKPDLHRPFQRVRLLVVQRDALVCRVLGRGVHTFGDVAARRRTEFVVEQRIAETGGELAKRFCTAHFETAKQNPAGAVQVPGDQRLEFAQRFHQVQTGLGCLHQHRQAACPCQQRPDIQTQRMTHDVSPLMAKAPEPLRPGATPMSRLNVLRR